LVLAACFAANEGLSAKAPAGPSRDLMINFGDIEYVSYMRVGHQTVNAILDTGSFETVIFSTTCKTCGQAAKFNPSQSKTHRTGQFMTLHTYGSGETYSLEASDVVSIGSFAERNLTFWEVVDAKMSILKSAEFNAIAGIGPPETPAADAWTNAQKSLDTVNKIFDDGRRPPLEIMKSAADAFDSALETTKAQTLLDSFGVNTFSMCMGAKPGSDGYVVWKDTIHKDKPNLFTTVPILGAHTWSVSLRNVRMQRPGSVTDTKLGCSDETGCSALVDSGTSLLAVPKEVLSKIQGLMTQLDANCARLHELPNLVFEMGGGLLSLPPDAYMAEVKGAPPKNLMSLNLMSLGPDFENSVNRSLLREEEESPKCKVLLMESYMESDQGPVWVFGMPFFRKYYTTFEVGENRSMRRLHVSEANDDCFPTERASLARSRPHAGRVVDIRRVHAPPMLKNFSGKVRL